MIAWATLFGTLLLVGLAEWLHLRRSRRVAALAFGPAGEPHGWVQAVPFVRVFALAGLAWGLVTLYLMAPAAGRSTQVPEGGYRHLVIALDVSPSMQLTDAGVGRKERRAQRATEVLMSMLSRIALDQVRISVVAFYNGAKPVVVDTYDLEVVRNIISDLPLDYAFELGKTKLFDGIREAATLAKPWGAGSTTLVLVSDGDTVPDTGMPELPRSIEQVLVIGVGDPLGGTYIDGHQSRQDAATLRQVAQRLRGVYHDGNEKHIPSVQLAQLSKLLPLKDAGSRGRREAALAAVSVGGILLAFLPVALAVAGSSWQAGVHPARVTPYGHSEPGKGKAMWKWLWVLWNPNKGQVP